MAKKKLSADTGTIGYVAFLLGVFIAILAGLFAAAGILTPMEDIVILSLTVLGLIAGLLNLMDKDPVTFLIAVIALSVVGSAAGDIKLIPGEISTAIGCIFDYLGAFVYPAGIIVALKAIWDMSKI